MTTTDRVKTLELQIKALSTRIAKLAADLAAVNDKSRRAGGSTDFAAQGAQNVVITWLKPFPDDQYGVWAKIYTSTPAQVHCVAIPATKTAAGITFSVVAASAVGTVTLDVLAMRSA